MQCRTADGERDLLRTSTVRSCTFSRGQVPLNRSLQPFAKISWSTEAEQFSCASGIETAARLAVGLAAVPDDTATEAGHLGNQLDQLPNRNFLPCPEVHRFRPIVLLGGQN